MITTTRKQTPVAYRLVQGGGQIGVQCGVLVTHRDKGGEISTEIEWYNLPVVYIGEGGLDRFKTWGFGLDDFEMTKKSMGFVK